MDNKNMPVVRPEEEKQAVEVIQDWAAFFVGLVPVVAAAANALGKVVDAVYDFVDKRTIKEN